jgi:hypothetical protein
MKETNATQAQKRVIAPCTYKEISNYYGVTPKTLRAWLRPFQDEIGPISGRLLKIIQVKTIFEKIGYPDGFEDE